MKFPKRLGATAIMIADTAKKVPLTSLLAGTMLLVGLVTEAFWHTAPAEELSRQFGYGLAAFREGNFIGVFTGLIVLPQPWMYLLLIPLLSLTAGYIEYRYGAVKMLATLLGSHLFAVFVVAGILAILEPSNNELVTQLIPVYDLGFSNAVFGAIGAASAGLVPLWRRRVRVATTLFCIAFMLFSGVIWDFTHFAGFLFGLAIGPWVVGRPYQFSFIKPSPQEVRNLIAILIVFNVFSRFAADFFPGNGGLLLLDNDSDKSLYEIGISALMLVFAYGISSGRKLAWRVVSGLTGLTLILDAIVIVFASDYLSTAIIFQTLITAILFGLLILFRRFFSVTAPKTSKRRVSLRLVAIATLFVVANSVIMFVLGEEFTPTPSFLEAFGEAVAQLFGLRGEFIIPTSTFAKAYVATVGVLWFLFVAGSIVYLVLSTHRATSSVETFSQYDALLHTYSTTSIGWMTRWPGMNYWLNDAKSVGIAFRLENNVAIVLSNPVGRSTDVQPAIRAFEVWCRDRGWRPCFYAVDTKTSQLLAKLGYSSIEVGEDTVIDLHALEFTGKAWQSVRSAVNRAKKEGVSMRTFQLASASVAIRDQLTTIANSWASDKSLPEMGFTLGTLTDAEDPEVRMHVAIDDEGTVHGMTSWMPIYEHGKVAGWTIDIMQRRLSDTAMSGVMEFLIAESAMAFKQEGYRRISLSAAPLAHNIEGKRGVIERLLDLLAVRMEPYYGFKSLDRFKQKFQPRREKMYLCYKDSAQLPSIALAIGKAYMPDLSATELIKISKS